MNSENLKNNLNSTREILPDGEQKVCDLIGKLDRVECPKNFDFHLKARIAGSDKKDFQPSVWQTLRYIVPVAACVLIVAFVMVQGGIFSPVTQTGNTIATATNPNIQAFDERSNRTQIFTVSNSSEPITAAVPDRNAQSNSILSRNVSLNNSSESRSSLPKLLPEDQPTMSKDFGVGQNIKPLYPNGINPDQVKPKYPETQDNRLVSIKQAFDIFGITAEMAAGRMKVITVRENSIADKSGIKAGDFIESIDDMKLTPGETTLRSNNVSKITVLRGGKSLQLSLKP
jgi:hypothetical protein